MKTALRAVFQRDLRLALRLGGGAMTGVLFFLVVSVLTPFAIGPDLPLLRRIGPAILWLGALLSSLLTLDSLLTADREDGSLDLLLTAPLPLEFILLAKAAAHWTTACLPLIVAAPLMGLLLDLGPAATLGVALTLLAGTPALTFTGLVGAALAVTLPRGGMLLTVLVLPLAVPVLIFGVSAAQGFAGAAASTASPFLFLCAISLASAVIGPFASATLLRHGTG